MVIDNTNLLQMCRDCGAVGFVPDVSYVYDAGAATITVTDSSTIPAGDSLVRIRIQVHDAFGGEVRDEIELAGGNQVVNIATLDRSKPLAIKVAIYTTNQIAADGGAYGLNAAGDISHWDVQKNA